MTSYFLYNCIVINLTNVNRFSNLVLKLKVPTKSFPKMYYLSISIDSKEKVMACFVFFIVTTFQI